MNHTRGKDERGEKEQEEKMKNSDKSGGERREKKKVISLYFLISTPNVIIDKIFHLAKSKSWHKNDVCEF